MFEGRGALPYLKAPPFTFRAVQIPSWHDGPDSKKLEENCVTIFSGLEGPSLESHPGEILRYW
jgi:hypothetical protein